MDQTTEAECVRFERIHSGDRSSDQWRLMTRSLGLDMDVRSLPSTPLLSHIDGEPAINRCRDEVIDRLSDIMTKSFTTFDAPRDWTAWYDTTRDWTIPHTQR